MPIIDLRLPRGALPRPALEHLAGELSRALLQCDVARNSLRAEAINWVYLHEHDPGELFVGGRGGGRPHYRIEVTVMEGAMSEAHRADIAALMTRAVLTAEGGAINPLNAGRVWVIFHEIPDGRWAAGGRLYRLEDVMRFVAGPHPPAPGHES